MKYIRIFFWDEKTRTYILHGLRIYKSWAKISTIKIWVILATGLLPATLRVLRGMQGGKRHSRREFNQIQTTKLLVNKVSFEIYYEKILSLQKNSRITEFLVFFFWKVMIGKGHLRLKYHSLQLYTATDADGNRGKCGFTITVLENGSSASNSNLPPPTATKRNRNSFKNLAEDNTNSKVNICNTVPNIENGRMVCKSYGNNGKKCSPICNEGHQFYQKFVSKPPVYLCLPPRRVDWKIRKFIPDCAPTHELPINGRQCEAGWEQRGAAKKCTGKPTL